MAKSKLINKQSSYINKIELTDFRAINNISFEPGKNLNVICGKNGTAKSTILGMIAQGFSFNPNIIFDMTELEYKTAVKKKDKISIDKYESVLTCTKQKFESNVNEHFKLSKNDAKGKKHAEITIESRGTFIIESNDYADRKNPRLVTRQKNDKNKTINSANVIFPVIYFGLNRLLPLVQSGTLKTDDFILEDKDLIEIHSLYESILLKQYENTPINISNSRKKNTLTFMNKERSLEMISSGEDNIGQILLALYSFKKLRDYYPNYCGGILLIDEVDATLYPAAQLKLIEIIYEKAVNFGIQIFLTTHSMDIIEKSMKLKTKNKYSLHAIKLFSLKNINNSITIDEVDNIQSIKNEFYASINKQIETDKINIYFEDKEAIYIFKNLVSSSSLKKVKINQKFTLGCTELLKLRKLKIPEFVNQSLVCLDGDNKVPKNYYNYFNLPIVKGFPPERFIYEIINDSKSDYWLQTVNYTHSIFMNNPYNHVLKEIINGSYGIEKDNNDGLYNNFGSDYYRIKPREVWKLWFNHEKQHFQANNNPISYWKKQDKNKKIYKKFLNDFEKALSFVSKEKGIVL